MPGLYMQLYFLINLCTLDCLLLFRPIIPLEKSSAEPYPPVSCTCSQCAQNQRQAQLHNPHYWRTSRWFRMNPETTLITMGLADKQTLQSCKMYTARSPVQKHPGMTILAWKKRSVWARFYSKISWDKTSPILPFEQLISEQIVQEWRTQNQAEHTVEMQIILQTLSNQP